ncbi:MAG: hypothetical protein J1F22_08765 [Lachnospiraceae bacterium]|nr:hypothetical protein [Lachnospiraceae bacterium]
MQIRIGGRKKIQFTDKTHPVPGIISFILGILSALALCVLFVLSSLSKGTSGIIFGFLGVLVFLVSVVGFILAVRCYDKEDIYLFTPAVGSVLNGLLIILCMMLYIMGAV